MSSRRSDWCKNYRGMHLKEACQAGVRFDSLPKHGTKEFFDSCPCFSREATGCDKAQYRTPEEIAADEEWLKKRFEGVAMAREAIVESCGGPWKRGMQGSGEHDQLSCLLWERDSAIYAVWLQRAHSREMLDRWLCQLDGMIYPKAPGTSNGRRPAWISTTERKAGR